MTSSAPIRLSTDDLPVTDRQAAIREHFGRFMQRMDYRPGSDEAMFMHAEAKPLSGVTLAHSVFSPITIERTPDLLTDGRDDVMLCRMPTGGSISLPSGLSIEITPGDFFLAALNYRLNFFIPKTEYEPTMMFQMSRSSLGGLAETFDDRPLRALPARMPELELLLGYGRSAMAAPLDSHTLQCSVSAHLIDLATLAIGAAREPAEIATRRGVRAAQLVHAKRELEKLIADPSLSATNFAARLQISPRYLHMLFEQDESTFSDYVMQQRLIRAYDLLLDPRWRHRRIIDVALEAGFREVRTFNRAFRQYHGMAPSELRQQAIANGGHFALRHGVAR